MEERQVVVPATLAGEAGEGIFERPHEESCRFSTRTFPLLQTKAVERSSTAFGITLPGEICLPQMILFKTAGLVRCLSLSSLW